MIVRLPSIPNIYQSYEYHYVRVSTFAFDLFGPLCHSVLFLVGAAIASVRSSPPPRPLSPLQP